SRAPAGPVHAFAFPDTTTTPRARPFFRRAAERSTGAARRRFCVNAPAAAAGPWATTSPMSFFPLGLIPAARPANRTPRTRVIASGFGRRGCGPVALLVLLAATARAGVVAPDLGLGAPHGRHLLRLGGLRRCLLLAALLPLGRVDRHHLPLLQLGQLLFLLPLDAHAEQLLPPVAGDVRGHLLEQVEPLLLVLLLGVLLSVAAQADALAQVLHRLEVLDPRRIDLLQVEVAREVEEERRGQVVLAPLEQVLHLRPQPGGALLHVLDV